MKILLFILFLILSDMSLQVNAQVSRIEPPNWWAGMESPDLQIMMYGKNISGSEVHASYKGLEIKEVTSPANPDYLFVDLRLSSDIKPGRVSFILTKDGKKETIAYELKKRREGSAEREGFNNSDVIYLLVPDRFANGDTSNDQLPGLKEGKARSKIYGRHGGDIKGISDHVDYIKSMGFTALWPTPLLENDQPTWSYHGYSITDFYKIDPRFGTLEDYIALSRKLNENGIKLIMDMVFNHCGSEHWWMKDLPFPDWINNYPDVKITNHRRTVNEDPHASDSDKRLMNEGWFVRSMPDLNQNNPFLAQYLIQNSIWWIETADLAGIRMDTYPYNDKYMMARWTKRVLDEYPHFNIVGEEWSYQPLITSYWQKGQNNRDGYEPGLPSLMDFPLQSALVKALTEPEEWDKGLINLYEILALDFSYPDPSNLVVIGDNHDMARFFMQLNKDTALYKMGIAFLLTTRGIPQIFYGSEILMSHPKTNEHGDIRNDFPGGWESDTVSAFTGEGLSKAKLQTQEYFRSLLNWRKESELIHTGKLMHFAPENGVYVYFRYNEEKSVMVVLNKNTSVTKLDPARFSERLRGYTVGKDVASGKEYSITEMISLPSKTALILELR